MEKKMNFKMQMNIFPDEEEPNYEAKIRFFITPDAKLCIMKLTEGFFFVRFIGSLLFELTMYSSNFL